MDSFREVVTLMLTVFTPPILLYWLVLHPWIRFWRRLGPALSFGFVWFLIGLAAAALFTVRDRMLAIDYGTHPALVTLGLACLLAAGWLRRKLRKHFSVRTLCGFPELAPDRHPQKLVISGLHGRVRHPRYLQLLLALLGWSLLANHLAAYLASALWIPGVWVIVRLEEKELRHRFGQEYEDYCRRVPRFLPRWR